MMQDDKSGFHIDVLENGIHQFRWTSGERAAVDKWMAYNDELYHRTSIQETLRFLHVIESVHFPPVSYIIRKSRQLQMHHPRQPATRSAILFRSRFFGSLINTLSQLLNRKNKDITRFYQLDQRDEAIAWLLEDSV